MAKNISEAKQRQYAITKRKYDATHLHEKRQRRAQHKTQHAWLAFRQGLKHHYGLTVDQYLQMLVQQQGVCAICKGPQCYTKGMLSVDHDHVTGRVRGLVCQRCNLLIGWLERERGVLNSALEYLGLGQ